MLVQKEKMFDEASSQQYEEKIKAYLVEREAFERHKAREEEKLLQQERELAAKALISENKNVDLQL